MASGRNILEEYREDLDKINAELGGFFDSRVALAEDMGAHALLGGGKRLRPLLFLLCCRLLSFWRDDLYRLSTIFECIHAASLLHDDVIDNSQMRRRRPSANSLWGNHAAVLEGDYLYSKAMTLAVESGSLEFLGVLTKATVDMSEGQILESAHQFDWDLSAEMYMEIIRGKTAALISAASSSAGIVAGGKQREIDSLAIFGLNVGMAFQLIDDLLDYVSTEKVFGKPVGKDIKEGKITLPLIYTLQGLSDDPKKEIREAFKTDKRPEAAVNAVIELVREGDALAKIHREAQGYLDKASSALGGFPPGRARDQLMELNNYLIERDF
ncbi:MAG: octaprenyl diphosphate synthase [Deltaproteobacteria bacterium CG_4_8_14_3_um_filter_51_11]|nr:polyprenyl synthetase family protein [bacterium]OIP43800.1 MAG: hypothetical protein AUK25_00515 [Desulfobacteraceae bacterium CG2_30_51_40]PIP47124.1 MAG: octaprenyl diphosphate synthase [Deltaproteobacteria bacterium CG23_combo_of_CG06-09_8_20_14_all_51_20]PIX19305.1 MAG: octaprenyl diphosphate synthase [Deltaproteobacteria bacterium CG_4_8_14_3_um_filter_51_11]PIY21714.1 MAG: octaprenyl diphosphate synthase [Deltaproteobacteria bacterium CG_4_10_14_3_um_filter_51_14]